MRQAHQDYRAAREQLTAAEAQQHAAERAVQTSDERFRAGATTLIELSQARARYVQAESALANARSNLLFQRTVMDYATGDLDPKKFTGE